MNLKQMKIGRRMVISSEQPIKLTATHRGAETVTRGVKRVLAISVAIKPDEKDDEEAQYAYDHFTLQSIQYNNHSDKYELDPVDAQWLTLKTDVKNEGPDEDVEVLRTKDAQFATFLEAK
jgi:hypothetical protein